MTRSLACLLVLLGGCSSDPCDETLCGACAPAITLTIVAAEGAHATVSGDAALECSTAGATTTCVSSADIAPGTYAFTITAPGYETAEATLEILPGGSGCCACPVQSASEHVDLVGPDAGASMPVDASADASVACRPDRVEFPMGGDLSPGTLCDDVLVCVADAAAAARVEAASPSFDCAVGPGGPCDGVRCLYRDPGGPSTLDDTEIQSICAITVLEPAPDRIICQVYL